MIEEWKRAGGQDLAAMSIELRPAGEADRDRIADVWHASASLPGVGSADMPSAQELRARLEIEFATGWDVTLAVREATVLGFVAIKPADRVLTELFVQPESVGSGVGQKLLDHAKAAMPGGFTLYTRSSNTRAMQFYDRHGLAETKRGVHPRSGDPIVYYEWDGR